LTKLLFSPWFNSMTGDITARRYVFSSFFSPEEHEEPIDGRK